MKKVYIWLSGIFSAGVLIHFLRLVLKLRMDINLHRIPLKWSVYIGLVCLILAIVFYMLGKDGE